MTRLTDKHTAAELKRNCDGLRAAGIDPPMSDLRYIRLAEYEGIEEITVAAFTDDELSQEGVIK